MTELRLFSVVPLRLLLRRQRRVKIVDVRPTFAEEKCAAFAQGRDLLSMQSAEVIRVILAVLLEMLEIDLDAALGTHAFELSIDEAGKGEMATGRGREMGQTERRENFWRVCSTRFLTRQMYTGDIVPKQQCDRSRNYQ